MSGVRITGGELDARLDYHQLGEEQRGAVAAVRASAKALADAIVFHAPPGRETSLALTHLEDAAMWANKAISRGES